MAELDENERRIINEFGQLQEKSKQLFNGLRYVFTRSLLAKMGLNCFPHTPEVLPIFLSMGLVVCSSISSNIRLT